MNDPIAAFADLIAAGPASGSPWEQVPAGEAAAILAITQVIEARVRAAAIATPPARRDAHPKMHGCVVGELRVLDGLPPNLAVGLFARPATYETCVRFSNGSGTPGPDSNGDGRGMAIKVMGVTGSRTGTQDFVMINNPTFFVANATDYVTFNNADNPFRFFVPDFNPLHVHLHDMLTALAIAGRRVSNPLNTQYWSMTPYLHGERPCKYSARPAGALSAFQDRSTPDFLRDNLVKALDAGAASFDFCIQLQGDARGMPVEDPTVEWPQADCPFLPVARLTIPRQQFDTPERREFGENLSFTPWHGLDAHRPLGGINRVRRSVYETISRVRHELNGALSTEPTGLALESSVPPLDPASTEASVADSFFDRFMSLAGEIVDVCPWADDAASMTVINALVHSTTNRPHPWSTASDYTSWKGLSDRTYQGRQLPVSTKDPSTLPDASKVAALFMRPDGQQDLSQKSTCLFPAFAQYLTDGFIRTGVPGQPETDANRARTSSNHEIDLCPLYGRTEAQTDALRLKSSADGRRGRLKTQLLNGEEFPPYLYVDGGTNVDPQFDGILDAPLGITGVAADRLASLFAIGGDRANATPFTAMMNTLFLREHNRIAGELEQQNPAWDDERVFQTARNIMIPIFIKIVVEQYINHITPLPFNLVANPQVAWTADWNRPNWITAEFSLLYRWHSLMPDKIDWKDRQIPLQNFLLDNRPLVQSGLADAFLGAAAQPAAELGALNTNGALMTIEELAIGQGRSNRIQSYNAYRVQYGMARATSFEQISSSPAVVNALKAAYATPDDVEFYPGIFAEDRVPKSPLPGLLMRMVGVDAFSQALTNPLLSQHVYNAQTFTQWGFQLIADTHNLGQLLARNCPAGAVNADDVVMTQKTWRY